MGAFGWLQLSTTSYKQTDSVLESDEVICLGFCNCWDSNIHSSVVLDYMKRWRDFLLCVPFSIAHYSRPHQPLQILFIVISIDPLLPDDIGKVMYSSALLTTPLPVTMLRMTDKTSLGSLYYDLSFFQLIFFSHYRETKEFQALNI